MMGTDVPTEPSAASASDWCIVGLTSPQDLRSENVFCKPSLCASKAQHLQRPER